VRLASLLTSATSLWLKEALGGEPTKSKEKETSVATRSVQITLNNNTQQSLTYYQDMLCHGSYTNNSPPPQTVAPGSTVQWQSQSDDPSVEGTEGWVKYTYDQDGKAELVFIYWNLPYFLMDMNSKIDPIYTQTDVTDIYVDTQHPPISSFCTTGPPRVWPNDPPGGFGNTITPGNGPPTTHLFWVDTDATNPPYYDPGSGGALLWNVIFAWPVILGGLSGDINLSFAVGLATNGSIGQRIRKFYDGDKGLRALAVTAHQPSVRKLFGI
jgi:hypothetical protein